jgi:hypothetical protein
VSGLVAGCAAAGLLTAAPNGVFVHRWTAFGLHRLLAESGRSRELADAHRRAADYWWSRVGAEPQDRRGLLEAKYHRAQAGNLGRRGQPVAGPEVAPARRRARAALAAAAVLAVVAGGGFAAEHLAASAGGPHHNVPPGLANGSVASPAAIRAQAAAWVAAQVSGLTPVACDPAMCAALAARGFPALELTMLRPGEDSLTGVQLVVATPQLRSAFGNRLASVQAPDVIASFGSGRDQVAVRAVAPGGAGPYQAELAADLAARKAAGEQLLRNPSVAAAPAARTQLAAGQVDSRLLIVLATMAAAQPIQITSFGDAGPGASDGQPLRAADVTVPAHPVSTTSSTSTTGSPSVTSSGPGLDYLLAFARAQRPPYQPAQARIVRTGRGAGLLSIEFAAPSPLGLLPSAAG